MKLQDQITGPSKDNLIKDENEALKKQVEKLVKDKEQLQKFVQELEYSRKQSYKSTAQLEEDLKKKLTDAQ